MAKPRILFYCHNLFGLGHIRRSTRLASACADLGASCTVVTGCRSLAALSWDSRITLEELPALAIGPDQQFHQAGFPDRIDVLLRRAEAIREVMERFSPDIFVVDYLPGGIGGELLSLGQSLSPVPEHCRVVWGVPYTKRISRPLTRPRNPRIRAWMDRFDAVLAYTDSGFEDPLTPLEPGGLPEKRGYSGFITGVPAATDAQSRRVVVLAGGGREATQMAPLLRTSFRPMVEKGEVSLRVIVGPLGDFEVVDESLGSFADVVAAKGVEEAVQGASVVVSRCGYNSAYTLLRTEAPIVFLPQISPCYEQLDRADGLRKIERVHVVREDEEGAGDRLTSVVREVLSEAHQPRNLPFAVDGDRVAAKWFMGLLH